MHVDRPGPGRNARAGVGRELLGRQGHGLVIGLRAIAVQRGLKEHASNLAHTSSSGGLASTTEVSIWRSGMVQWVFRSSALRSGATSSKPWRR